MPNFSLWVFQLRVFSCVHRWFSGVIYICDLRKTSAAVRHFLTCVVWVCFVNTITILMSWKYRFLCELLILMSDYGTMDSHLYGFSYVFLMLFCVWILSHMFCKYMVSHLCGFCNEHSVLISEWIFPHRCGKIWPIACVDSSMIFQCWILNEPFPIGVAQIWPLTHVAYGMLFQSWCAPKSFCADLTKIWFVTSVASQVCL